MAFAKHHTVGTEVLYPAFTSASVGGEYHESPTVLLRIKSKPGAIYENIIMKSRKFFFPETVDFIFYRPKIENKVIVLEMEEV